MNRSAAFHNYARQRGMATILIVLLAGMAITATTLGVMHTVRSTQDQQMASHASTEAESLAWAGAELLRLYLTKAEISQIEALSFNQNLIEDSLANKITATRKALTTAEDNVPSGSAARNFAFEVTGKTSLATSTLRIVYNVTSGGGNGSTSTPIPPPAGFTGTMNIYDNLDLSGGLTFKGGSNVSLNIDGSANISGGVKGLNILRATGDITLSGGVEKLQQLVSNGNVTFSGSTSAQLVSALGNISITAGGDQGTLNSNGNVTISNNGNKTGTINALGNIDAQGTNGTLTAAGTIKVSNGTTSIVNAVKDVTVTGGAVGTINTEGNVQSSSTSTNVKAINANGSVQAYGANTVIRSVGDVTLSGGTADVTTKGSTLVQNGSLSQLLGQRNLTFNNWGSAKGVVGGTITKAEQWNTSVAVTTQPGLIVDISPIKITTMQPLQAFTLTRPTVDARTLENSANYAFKYVGGKELITVKNVNGLANDNYRLGKIKKNWNENWGYLCKDTNSEGYCIPECTPIADGNCKGQGVDALKLFCHGQSLQNKCLSYNTSSKTWTLDGSQNNQVIAPGIAWFEGNLKLGNGLYRNTFLATGVIDAASGSVSTYATNYVGYTHNCQNALYGSLYPSNLCSNAQFQSTSLGNIALLAGSYDGATYQGGDISVGSSTKAYGDIIAGNQISGSGGATIYGYITAAGIGASTKNSLTAGLTVDLSSPPATYTPGDVPNMGGDTGNGGNDGSEGTDNTVKRLWVRPI